MLSYTMPSRMHEVGMYTLCLSILKADFHSTISGARDLAIDILRTHGEYQITLQLHLRKLRALKSSHLLLNKNVFKGAKQTPCLLLKLK